MAGWRARAFATLAFALAAPAQTWAMKGPIAQQAMDRAAANPGSREAPLQSERLIELIEHEPPSSRNAPHIDWVTLREERDGGRLYIVQKIGYRSSNGNATNLHFQLASVSRANASVRLSDHAIHAPSARQQRGTYIVARFSCGRFNESYSHVKLATIIDADGERSNTVEFTVGCNLAFTS
jgi:hypothetical protein